MIVFGDSHAAGWDNPVSPDEGRSLNLGIGGQTSRQIQLRYLHHVQPFRAKYVLVFAGGNDISAAGWLPEWTNNILNELDKNIEGLARQIKQDKAIPILSTIPLPRNVGWKHRHLNQPELQNAIKKANESIRKIAGEYGVLLDTAKVLESQENQDSLRTDGIHLSVEAYAILQGELIKAISKHTAD